MSEEPFFEFHNQAFVVVELLPETNEVRPLTATSLNGYECLCLFTEKLFADRAIDAWNRLAQIIPLNSPSALNKALADFGTNIGIDHVTIDFQPNSKQRSFTGRIDAVRSKFDDGEE